MTRHDVACFTQILDGVCSLLSRGTYKPNDTNAAMWFRALSEHDLADVRAAFDAHVKDPDRGRFAPVPADIIGKLRDLRSERNRERDVYRLTDERRDPPTPQDRRRLAEIRQRLVSSLLMPKS